MATEFSETRYSAQQGADAGFLVFNNTADFNTLLGDVGDYVLGPVSVVDERIGVYNGTTGKLIKDGGQTVAGVLARANHTGTQLSSTISDFDTEVANNSAVAANTAKTGVTTQISNVIEDTTPQLGGDLDANGFDIQFDDAKGIRDDSDNEQLIFQKTASAVNEFEMTNAATANDPQLAVTGGDTNIGMNLVTKGTGTAKVNGKRIPTTVKLFSFPFDNGASALATGNSLSIEQLGTHTLTDLKWTSKVGDTGAITVNLQEASVTSDVQGAFSTIETLTQLAGKDVITKTGLSADTITDGKVYRANISANSGSITGGVLVGYGTLD